MAATMSKAMFIATMLVVTVAPPAEAALGGCGKVVSYVSVCVPYLTNKGPLGSCCNGVRGLNGAAKTTADRRASCGCLKSFAGSIPGNNGRFSSLPPICGVHFPYPIGSNSTDCSNVK